MLLTANCSVSLTLCCLLKQTNALTEHTTTPPPPLLTATAFLSDGAAAQVTTTTANQHTRSNHNRETGDDNKDGDGDKYNRIVVIVKGICYVNIYIDITSYQRIALLTDCTIY